MLYAINYCNKCLLNSLVDSVTDSQRRGRRAGSIPSLAKTFNSVEKLLML